MFDMKITGAKIFDGAGTPFYFADVAVKDGKICAVGKNIEGRAAREIDARGMALSPGFIDAHSHIDIVMDQLFDAKHKLEQGVTTEVSGSCGMSPAPLSQKHYRDGLRASSRLDDCDFQPHTRASYRAFMDAVNINYGANMLLQIGHGTARAAVCGYADRALDSGELEQLKGYIAEAMEAGVSGVSFGLIYPPGAYAGEAELAEVSKVVASYGGVFTTHMRNEGSKLVESVEETIRIAESSGCRGVISHHKASGKANHGKTERTLQLIEEANARGVEIFLDQYPYNASSTGLSTMIPTHMHALGIDKLVEMMTSREGRLEMRRQIEIDRGVPPGGDVSSGLDHIMIASSNSHPQFDGTMLHDAAKQAGADPLELMLDILRDDRISTGAIYFTMGEEDIERVMKYPRTMVGTDGLYEPGKMCHPRAIGTFPRFLGRYVRDKGLMTMEEGIRRITSMPAAVHGLSGKGLIKPGMDADLVLFNPETIIDNATYKDYAAPNTGIEAVFVAGQPAVLQGVATGVLAGRLIRR